MENIREKGSLPDYSFYLLKIKTAETFFEITTGTFSWLYLPLL